MHKANIGEELGLEMRKQIENILDICTTTDAVVKTRSDFSDDELTETELKELKAWSEDIKDIYALTPSQKGMYAQYFQSTDTKTYQLQSVCRIEKETSIEDYIIQIYLYIIK